MADIDLNELEEESALSRADVARLLDLDEPGDVDRMLADGQLYAITTKGGDRRFPRWQFHKRGVLPGLPAVLSAVPPDLRSSTLGAFMTRRTDAFTGHVRDRQSPVQWLVGGGEPSLVANLMEQSQYD